MKRPTLTYIGGACVITALLIAGSVIAFEAAQTRRSAEGLLLEARELRVGDSNSVRVLQLAEKYHGGIRKGVECKPSNCAIDIEIRNRSLSRFHLAPPTSFAVSFFTSQGRSVQISFGMMSTILGPTYYLRRWFYGEAPSFTFAAEVLDDLEKSEFHQSDEKYSALARRDYFQNRPEILIVHLTPKVDLKVRDKALAFNLSCLSKLGGCRDASEFLPVVWRESDKAN